MFDFDNFDPHIDNNSSFHVQSEFISYFFSKRLKSKISQIAEKTFQKDELKARPSST